MDANIVRGPKSLNLKNENGICLGSLILDKIRLYKGRTWMVDPTTNEELTFKDLLKMSIRTAESLTSIGIKKGDVFAICSENHLNYFVPILSAVYIGAMVTPLYDKYNVDEIVQLLKISKPKLIFCSSATEDRVVDLKNKLPFIRHVINLDFYGLSSVETFDQFLSRSSPIDDYDYYNKVADCDAKEQVQIILNTSGTTGSPKGVAVTQFSLFTIANIQENENFSYYTNNYQNVLCLLPLSLTFGFTAVFASIFNGMQVVLLKTFEEELFFQTIQDYEVNYALLVPSICTLIANSLLVDKYNLSSFEEIIVGGSKLNPEVQDMIQKRLKIKSIRRTYASAEATMPVLLTTLLDSFTDKKSNSVGMLIPDLECKVVDLATNKMLGPNQNGELYFRGPMLMKCYYENTEETENVFIDGWLRSGDVGYYDEDKCFYVEGKVNDIIKFKEHLVSPAEVENVILDIAGVKEALVVCLPNEETDELFVAFVVKELNSDVSKAEIIDSVEKKLPCKNLRGGVKFVSEIPKNAIGQTSRRKLRNIFK